MSTLSRLSLDEKAELTAGADIWHTAAVERLGIPALRLTDGPSGARGTRFSGNTSTSLPCGTALAATWDRDLVHRVGGLLADEARGKDAHVLLAPTVNLHRHPLNGRHFECFSEDPYLSAELAVAYIVGVQGRGVGCAVKHFVANDQEHDRMEISVEVDERTLREIYLPPFEAAVGTAGVWSVMAAYNRLHGVHCSEHSGLLEGILRRDWAFDGLVMSDWYGTHSTTAVTAGLDLEMPGPARFLGHYLAAAVRQGEVDGAALDRAVENLLGLVDRVAGRELADSPAGEAPSELARTVAREAMVLLRNNGILPLTAREKETFAVLGPKADRPDIQGGGSAHVDPPYTVTPLAAITERVRRDLGDAVQVMHEAGVPRRPPLPLGEHELRVPATADPGLLVEHFAGTEIGGTPIHTEVMPETRLFWLGPPVPTRIEKSGEDFSIRARADLIPDLSGTWSLGLSSAGRSRLLIDGEVVVDNMAPERGKTFFGQGSTEVAGAVELTAGRTYELVAELYGTVGSDRSISGLAVTAQPPEDVGALDRAVAVAAAADVAIVVVGGETADTEGHDRPDMDLPADQVALVRAVAGVNPQTVVLVNSGAPVTMDWVDEVGAVAQVWYLGQEAGHAIADVLFGDVDAAGRLPTTFPQRLADTPAFATYPGADGRARYAEGIFVGYRHYDANQVEPRFCFGHGLSYTRFEYGDLQLDVVDPSDPAAAGASGPQALVTATVDVTNVGDRPGREVVQLYVRDVDATVARPEQELKQFAKVGLAPGETRTVRLELDARAFSFWDGARHGWVLEPGEFEVRVGSSSRNIHMTGTIRLP
jgi:beta-glucosidase